FTLKFPYPRILEKGLIVRDYRCACLVKSLRARRYYPVNVNEEVLATVFSRMESRYPVNRGKYSTVLSLECTRVLPDSLARDEIVGVRVVTGQQRFQLLNVRVGGRRVQGPCNPLTGFVLAGIGLIIRFLARRVFHCTVPNLFFHDLEQQYAFVI